MGGVYLLTDAVIVHGVEIGRVIVELVALLECPGVVEDIGLSALAVGGAVFELELSIGPGQAVNVPLHGPYLEPYGVVGGGGDGLALPSVALDRLKGHSVPVGVESQELVRVLGAVFIGGEHGIVPALLGKYRPHGVGLPLKGGQLGKAVAVHLEVVVGQAHLGALCSDGRGVGEICQALIAAGLCEAHTLFTRQDVSKAHEGRFFAYPGLKGQPGPAGIGPFPAEQLKAAAQVICGALLHGPRGAGVLAVDVEPWQLQLYGLFPALWQVAQLVSGA